MTEKIKAADSNEGYKILAEKLTIPGGDKMSEQDRIEYVKNIIKMFVEL